MAPPPTDRPAPEDPGPDLLAHVRGELSADLAREIDGRLAASPALRAERDRLAADHDAWCRAAAADTPSPRPETLPRLIAAVRDEAAVRRAAAAVARANLDNVVGGDVVALAFGALDDTERARVEALVGADPVLRDEVHTARRLATLTRSAVTITPRADVWQSLVAQIAAEGPAPVLFDGSDIPEPARRRRRTPRILRLLPPLVAAAAAVVLLFVGGPEPTAARVMAGAGMRVRGPEGDIDTSALGLGPGRRAFRFRDGDVLEAQTGSLTVRVSCRADMAPPSADGPAAPGTAEFVLEPGARLARADTAHFDLLAGRLVVAAHDLGPILEVRAGALYAAVTGTRFTLTFTEGRLVAVVHEGTVELGRRGSNARSVRLVAGEQGLVDAERLLTGAADARDPGSTFLTPVAALACAAPSLPQDAPLRLEAELRAGEGGAVRIAAFDASVPLFLIRLMGPEGREQEVKVQDAMLAAPAPDVGDAPTWRLAPGAPYRLVLEIGGLDLEPGRWEARLRYMSYRIRSQGAEWLGVVESPPVTFEVTPR